ncbi:Charged multivesicular body protein 6-A [Yarrowia sp. C11]|nr:Charged multivesicular body protein 6-A [Yarrowia sp. C11]KAG5364216.1 Charged multivesicular body protein 6-A [Yarrowia sp. E02]
MGNQSSKGIKVTSQDKAILDLKLQRDKLKQYKKKIQVVLDSEVELAKEALRKGDKKRALLALRKKKYQEGMLTKTDEQLETLENLTSSIEFALVQKDVVYGLEQGNKVLKEINQEISLDRVERLRDETEEGIAYQEEVSAMLMSNISNADEEDVQAELEALEQQELAKQPVKQPAFPEVPTDKIEEPLDLPKVPEGVPEEAGKDKQADKQVNKMEPLLA